MSTEESTTEPFIKSAINFRDDSVAANINVSSLDIDYFQELIVSSAYFVAMVASIVVYIVALQPLASLVFQDKVLRYEVQGYCLRIVDELIAKVYDRAFEIHWTGLDSVQPENFALVLSNHQGFLDYLTIINLASKCEIDNSTFFFVWKHCVRLPSLRALYNLWRGNSDWVIPEEQMLAALSPALESPRRKHGGKWIAIFPEVTPWSATALVQHRNECFNKGCPKLDNLLYPRFHAFTRTVQSLRSQPLNDLYSLTINYIDTANDYALGVPTWRSLFLSRKQWIINISVKQINISQLPSNTSKLERWLEKHWFQKDAEVAELKKQFDKEEPAKLSQGEA